MRETVSGSFSLSQFQPAVKGQHSFTLMFIPSFPFCHLMLMRYLCAWRCSAAGSFYELYGSVRLLRSQLFGVAHQHGRELGTGGGA